MSGVNDELCKKFVDYTGNDQNYIVLIRLIVIITHS